MSKSQTLSVLAAALIASISGTSAYASGNDQKVHFKIDMNKSRAEIATDIRAKARKVCRAEVIDGSVEDRLRLADKCERRLIAQAMREVDKRRIK